MRGRKVGRFSWLIGFHAALFVVLMAEPAGADNCQTFTDCFFTAGAASDSALGMAFLGMLSMGLNFVPYVGTAKGLIEAVIGRDLLTGQELSMTDRMLGLIPGGRLGRLGTLGRGGDDVFDMARVGPGGRGITPPPGKGVDRPPPPPPPGRGGGGDRPPPPPPGRGPGSPDPDDVWRNRPARDPDGNDVTNPQRGYDPDRRATGDPEKPPNPPKPSKRTDESMRQYEQRMKDYNSQLDDADLLAQHGFDAQHRGGKSWTDAGGNTRTADYEINGRPFENKRVGDDVSNNDPDSWVQRNLEANANKFRTGGGNVQADRFVVDISNGKFTPEQIRASIISRNSSPEHATPPIQEVILVDNGRVIPIFP